MRQEHVEDDEISPAFVAGVGEAGVVLVFRFALALNQPRFIDSVKLIQNLAAEPEPASMGARRQTTISSF